MRGLPGRRVRRGHHRENPSRCHRSTVAGWTSSARSATEATRVARPARSGGQPSESADSNERGRATDDAGRGFRIGGLAVSTTRTGSLRWSARCDASRVEWRAASPPSTYSLVYQMRDRDGVELRRATVTLDLSGQMRTAIRRSPIVDVRIARPQLKRR